MEERTLVRFRLSFLAFWTRRGFLRNDGIPFWDLGSYVLFSAGFGTRIRIESENPLHVLGLPTKPTCRDGSWSDCFFMEMPFLVQLSIPRILDDGNQSRKKEKERKRRKEREEEYVFSLVLPFVHAISMRDRWIDGPNGLSSSTEKTSPVGGVEWDGSFFSLLSLSPPCVCV